jgi:hypothetical protein
VAAVTPRDPARSAEALAATLRARGYAGASAKIAYDTTEAMWTGWVTASASVFKIARRLELVQLLGELDLWVDSVPNATCQGQPVRAGRLAGAPA